MKAPRIRVCARCEKPFVARHANQKHCLAPCRADWRGSAKHRKRCLAEVYLRGKDVEAAQAFGEAHGRSIGWAFARAWRAARDEIRALPEVPDAERIQGVKKAKVHVELGPFAAEMRAVAEAHERPVGWCVAQAWLRARDTVRALAPEPCRHPAPRRERREPRAHASVYLGEAIATQLEELSAEKGLLKSRLFEEAWRLARDTIRAMPAPGEPVPSTSVQVHVPAATPVRPLPFSAPGLRRSAA